MSKVSKLVIKACRDNKFSSFIGEFITSINPENLVIKSAVSYHVPEGMVGSSLLKYRGSPPKLLSFSLLFDNTGIIPGSNTVAVMEQVKQLQEVAYNVHKKNNAPNYIRVIWGQIDFKGRLEKLDIVYSMFQVDGTLVRAEAYMAVLEEVVPLGRGRSDAGVDSNYAKPSGASATSQGLSSQRGGVPPSYQKSIGAPSHLGEAIGPPPPYQQDFAPTPNGMHGAYSGAPPGAYDGGADQIYQGSSASGHPVYASSSVGTSPSGKPVSTVKQPPASDGYDSDYDSDAGRSGSGLQGGVAGNGPGGSGGGVGGGGHGPGSGPGKSGKTSAATGTNNPAGKSGASSSSRGAGSDPTGAAKSNVAPGSGGANEKGSRFKAGSIAAGGAVAAAAAAGGADSLRKLKADVSLMQKMKEKVSFWRRLQKFVKKVVPKKIYDAGKNLGKKI